MVKAPIISKKVQGYSMSSNVINLREQFGVLGDGTSADATRFANALAFAIANGCAGYLPSGVYTFNQQTSVYGTVGADQSLTLLGDRNSVLKMGNAFPVGTGASLLRTNGIDNVHIASLRFNGNRSGLGLTNHAVYLGGLNLNNLAGSCDVEDCRFEHFVGDCVDVTNGANVRCNNNLFADSLAAQIYVRDSLRVELASNVVTGIGIAGGSDTLIGAVQLLVGNSRYIRVHDNIIVDSPDTASKTEGCSDVVYANNIVDGYGKDGLKIQNIPTFTGPTVYRGTFIGNQVARALDGRSDGRGAIICHGLDQGTICGNVIVGGYKTLYKEYGIALSDGNSHIVICNNTVGATRDKSIAVIKNTSIGMHVNSHISITGNRCNMPMTIDVDTVDCYQSDNVIENP